MEGRKEERKGGRKGGREENRKFVDFFLDSHCSLHYLEKVPRNYKVIDHPTVVNPDKRHCSFPPSSAISKSLVLLLDIHKVLCKHIT